MIQTLSKAWKKDLSSSISLLMISIPISAGIAVASKASPEMGIITAIFGALFFGFLSSSPLLVYGPSAGLAVFISAASMKFGDFSLVSGSVVIAGALLFSLSFLNFHRITHTIPSSVIKGMSSGIGLILILKMIPHFFGYDGLALTTEEFSQNDGRNTLSEISFAFNNALPGATIISLISIAVLSYLRFAKKRFIAGKISFAVIIVLIGVFLNLVFKQFAPEWHLSGNHVLGFSPNISLMPAAAMFVKFDQVFETGLMIAMVIFFESLITMDIFRKLDPKHTHTNPQRELMLLGIGNVFLGFIGALPVMPVLIRSTANVAFGAASRWSVIIQGILLFVAFQFNNLFSYIPMASVAAVLFFVGLTLINVEEVKRIAKSGTATWLPFAATVLIIAFVNLLWGLLAGFLIGLFFSMKSSIRRTMVLVNDDKQYLLKFHKDVTFLNKGELRELLDSIPMDKEILIDGTGNIFIDREIEIYLEDFIHECRDRGCQVTLMTSRLAVSRLFKEI